MATPQQLAQQNIQRSTGLQGMAQANVPSAVNNGNPNTVYNVAPGQLPPVLDLPYTPWTAPAGQTVNPTQIVWPNPVFLTGGTEGVPVTPTNPPIPPKTGKPGGGGGGLGFGGGSGFKPSTQYDPTKLGNYSPGQPGWESVLKGAGIDPGPRNSNGWNSTQQWSSAVFDRLAGAKEVDGSWDWRQIADMVTEPLLGGNLWLSGTNKWDASNGVAALIQAVTGIPVGNLMNKLGEIQANQNDPVDSWLEKILADHWTDNAMNDVRIFQDTLNNYMGKWADSAIKNVSTNNANWVNNYTDALAKAMLNGLKGQAAEDAARKAADAAARQTGPTGDDKGGGRGGRGGGRDLGFGVHAVGGGCVVVDNIIDGYERADAVKVNDQMNVIDGRTYQMKKAHVSQSETVIRPCVRVETERGVILECSIDAEIADLQNNRVLAANLAGVHVPTIVNGRMVGDVVAKVTPIGELPVQKITAENNWYLAGKLRGKYLLHHNVKYYNDYGNRTTASGWQGSGSITPNGLLWGW